jgi:hypothetical protein
MPFYKPFCVTGRHPPERVHPARIGAVRIHRADITVQKRALRRTFNLDDAVRIHHREAIQYLRHREFECGSQAEGVKRRERNMNLPAAMSLRRTPDPHSIIRAQDPNGDITECQGKTRRTALGPGDPTAA